MQKSIDRPIYLVPQLMFFSKTARHENPTLIDILFGPEDKPGKIRRLYTLSKNAGKVFVEMSEPLNLKQYLQSAQIRHQSTEYQSLVLRRNLVVRLNRHRQSITGPIRKSREELKESILTSGRFQRFMDTYAEKRNISIQEVHRKADALIEEIAANYKPAFIKIAAAIVAWITRTMFDGVATNHEVLNKVKNMSQKGPLVLVPCHKSHIDYLILDYVLYHNNMQVPHIAAGKNLSFWPMGPIFRSGGAFFLRRSFGGAVLISAFKSGACEDMIIVPIHIGYDRIIEEKSYLHELGGGQKEAENFFQVIRARKFLKKRYGKIYIQFHEPISLNQLLSRYNQPLGQMTAKEKNALIRNLGYRVLNAINRVAVVTPHAVVASAILNFTKETFSFNELLDVNSIYLKYLAVQNAKLADTLVSDRLRAFEQVIDSYSQRKIIERIGKDKNEKDAEEHFLINEDRRLHLEYYKNNCIAFFIPAAYTAIAILQKDTFRFSAPELHDGYAFWQSFFKYEFAADIDNGPGFNVRKTIKTFIDDGIVVPHQTLPDTYDVTPTGFRKLKLFALFLKTFLESYWIVLNYFMRNPQNSVKSKDHLKKITNRGNRMYKRKEIWRKEALSKVSYQNAVELFTSKGIKGTEDTEKIKIYAAAIQNALKHLHP
jgi:glycerol-3-phosphate O-acyltransferase